MFSIVNIDPELLINNTFCFLIDTIELFRNLM